VKQRWGNLFLWIKKHNKLSLLLAASVILVLIFQNCSAVKMSYDYASVDRSMGMGLIIENGQPATNKKAVAVSFTGNDLSSMTQMRLATTSNMDAAAVPWQPYSSNTFFDFGSDWASDGSKDGLKFIYAEVRQNPSAPSVALQGNIGLDTVFPTIAGDGILATGIQGQHFVKGQSVALNWHYGDQPAGPNNYSSGIDPRGFKIGYTRTADCGGDVTWLGDWQAAFSSMNNFVWPAALPSDTFYVCMLIKDVAGNTTTMQSQPLASVWSVLAGDNNQGNGGGVGAPNVRFKQPSGLVSDSKGNIFVIDRQFNVIREISSDTRTITTYAGNGHSGAVVSGNALQTALGNNQAYAMATDSKDRLYFGADNTIYRVTKDPRTGVNSIGKIAALNNIASFTVRKTATSESLLIHGISTLNPNQASSNAYLYEVPMSVIDALSAPLSLQDLKSHYILAGNGVNPLTSFKVPATQVLTNHDGTDPKFSVGEPGAITTGPSGEIYLATWTDGHGEGWGSHTLRRLTYQSDGSLLQELLSNAANWVTQLSYFSNPVSGDKFLLVGGYGGFVEVDLRSPTFTLTTPLTQFVGQQAQGVLTVKSLVPGGAPSIYISGSTLSNISHFDAHFGLIETLGRSIYNEIEPVATLAMIGQPEGLTQDSHGNTYFFDSENSVVREVTSTGTVRRVAGVGGAMVSQINNNVSVNDARFSGLSAFAGGYFYNLVKDFEGGVKMLYLSSGASGHIDRIDLNAGIVSTISGTGGTRNGPFNWATGGMTIASNSHDLLINRYCPYAAGDCGGSYEFTGLLSTLSLANPSAGETRVVSNLANAVDYFTGGTSVPTGTQALNMPDYTNPTLRVDSVGNSFFSYHGLYMSALDANGNAGPIVNIPVDHGNSFGMTSFEVIEDGTDRVFIYAAAEKLWTFRVPLAQLSALPVITSQPLCLPATFLNQVRALSLAADGNLLISDSGNGRILEYFIRDAKGALALPLKSCDP